MIPAQFSSVTQHWVNPCLGDLAQGTERRSQAEGWNRIRLKKFLMTIPEEKTLGRNYPCLIKLVIVLVYFFHLYI